jgi:hypothetical protein
MAITDLLLAGKVVVGEPDLDDGEVSPLPLNPDGRLRVASKPGYFDPNTANLLNVGETLPVDVTDASNIVIHIKNTGTVTLAAGTFIFEGSIDSTNGTDGTWFAIQAARSNSNTVELQNPTFSIAAGAGNTYAWEASVNAVRWIRIRCSVAPTASAIPTWTVIRGTYATEPIPALQTHAVTGSGNFLVAPASGTTYNAVSTASTNAAVVKSTAGNLCEISVFNPTGATVYIKLYNKTTAPTVGTDVPVATIPVAAGAFMEIPFGTNGKRFATGIGIATTAGAAATDVAAIGAGVQINATHL